MTEKQIPLASLILLIFGIAFASSSSFDFIKHDKILQADTSIIGTEHRSSVTDCIYRCKWSVSNCRSVNTYSLSGDLTECEYLSVSVVDVPQNNANWVPSNNGSHFVQGNVRANYCNPTLGRCYYISSFGLTVAQATEYCVARGMIQLSMETIVEFEFIRGILVSLNNEEGGGLCCYWNSGSAWMSPTTNQYGMYWSGSGIYSEETGWWVPGEPTRASDCSFFLEPDQFYLHDGNCQASQKFICEGDIAMFQ